MERQKEVLLRATTVVPITDLSESLHVGSQGLQ